MSETTDSTPAREESTAAQPLEPRATRRPFVRRLLLLIGPIAVLAAAGYVYMTGGRFVGTDNAYVQSDLVVVSAQVSGPIVSVDVRENQSVAAGDVLFAVDDRPYRVALARADAQLRAVESMIESVEASYRQKLEELQLARTNVAYSEHELEREQTLAEQRLGSDAAVDRARHDYDVAERQIHIVERGLEQLRAQLGGTTNGDLSTQPAYLAMKAAVESAALDLEHTVVRAPFDGVASKVPVVGQYVAPGVAVMSVVADHDVWVEANYKETDLAYVCAGQSAGIHVDAYPDREWRGEVASISQATGAEFSVIPAQNATGNWVKVIQRVPVRIAVRIDDDDPPLRTGMSVEVEIDTGHERGMPALPVFGNAAVADDAGDKRGGCNAG